MIYFYLNKKNYKASSLDSFGLADELIYVTVILDKIIACEINKNIEYKVIIRKSSVQLKTKN